VSETSSQTWPALRGAFGRTKHALWLARRRGRTGTDIALSFSEKAESILAEVTVTTAGLVAVSGILTANPPRRALR
jgi:hypothetical protein